MKKSPIGIGIVGTGFARTTQIPGFRDCMTNSLNTPAEALEYAYPLRVREYRLRKGSGGKGKHRGGDGVVREIETVVPARMSLLADRRKQGPYGLQGGDDGQAGTNVIIRNGQAQKIKAKGSHAAVGSATWNQC